jgi:hypothetical protein
VSALPTDGTGFGLLPTAQTQGLKMCDSRGKTVFHPLGLLPTPVSIDAGSGRMNRSLSKNAKARPTIALAAKMGLLPTPASRNYKGASSIEALKARGRFKPKADDLANQFAVSGMSSQLNPLFVAEMMGFPSDWTVFPFQGGEKNRLKPTATQ